MVFIVSNKRAISFNIHQKTIQPEGALILRTSSPPKLPPRRSSQAPFKRREIRAIITQEPKTPVYLSAAVSVSFPTTRNEPLDSFAGSRLSRGGSFVSRLLDTDKSCSSFFIVRFQRSSKAKGQERERERVFGSSAPLNWTFPRSRVLSRASTP